jgi:hypothetical protein
MGMTGVIIVQKWLEAEVKCLHAVKAATGQKAALQHAKEQLGLIELRTVLGRKMKHVAMTGITQKRPALDTRAQLVGFTRDVAPARHETTDLQTPVGVQVVHDPVITLHPW